MTGAWAILISSPHDQSTKEKYAQTITPPETNLQNLHNKYISNLKMPTTLTPTRHVVMGHQPT
jgi:hypothetical protein